MLRWFPRQVHRLLIPTHPYSSLQRSIHTTRMSAQVWHVPAPDAVPAPVPPPIRDIHSYANVNELKPESLHIDWTIDWDNKRILGSVTHHLQALTEVSRAIFDTSFLAVHSVLVDGQEASYRLNGRHGPLGEPLEVDIGARKAGERVDVKINYATTSKCTALGWLSKEQTHTKKTPFLYSQCQAIHGRSMIPCMDSPSRKVTYTASVTSTIPVLMSALQEQEPQDAENGAKRYTFRQPVAIPTYLLAIVGGLLEFRSLGPRTGVWAEPTDADKVQWEFEADAERFLTEAEKLVSPYSWTRYDSVVLPPSFPYGGMENANLTTLTPSLVCGDRSSTDVLLHELCHSWSGNLISCVNWESFWLNEGWTVYLERLLLQMVHADDNGPGHRGFSYVIGTKALRDSLEDFADTPRFQRLIPVYHDGEDPDDAFSSIPYDKGANFLLYLERQVGGLENFVPYIKAYFHTFAGRSVSTEEWREHLFSFFAGNEKATQALHEVDWDAWLHGEGVELPVAMEYDESLAVEAFALADRWIQAILNGDATKFDKADMDGWNASQVVVFLEKLHAGPRVPASIARCLDEMYGLSTAANTEIRLRFYEVALEDKHGVYAQEAADWVCMCYLCQVKMQGRMKYCRTIFKALHKVEPALAKQTFLDNENFYHPIAAAMIRKVRIGDSRSLHGRTSGCRTP